MLAYKKSASSNAVYKEIEGAAASPSMCNCCREEIDPTDHCRLSCGHVYHYDCIYFAFCANKKRHDVVKECPYCRNKVSPLPEKEGYPFDNYIHSWGDVGAGTISKKIDKSHFAPIHLGKGYCAFKNGYTLFCNSPNATYGVNSCYCFGHRNAEHLGKNYCKYKTSGGIYCNEFLISHPAVAFCKTHSATIECTEVIKTGKNKGTVCGNMNCKRHKPKKDVADNMVASASVNSIKIVELDDKSLLSNEITVYKEVADAESIKPITLNASQVAEIRFLLESMKHNVSQNEENIIDNLLDNYFS